MLPTRPSPLWELDCPIQVGPPSLGWNFLWIQRLVMGFPRPSVGHGAPTFQGPPWVPKSFAAALP